LTVTDLLAGATRTLEEAGYKRIERLEATELNSPGVRVFEDVYNIVAVAAFNTWEELSTNWSNTQAALAELISRYLDRSDAKAWDGYLVLMCPTILNPMQMEELSDIRYDTSRLRKLIAAGKELTVLNDIERVLAPLLPLSLESLAPERRSVLDELPSLLSAKGVPAEAVKVAVEAYQDQQPLLETLNKYRSSHENNRS